ncbi:hypothetical protein D3C75_1031380 [compost metagenome]
MGLVVLVVFLLPTGVQGAGQLPGRVVGVMCQHLLRHPDRITIGLFTDQCLQMDLRDVRRVIIRVLEQQPALRML